MNVEVLFIVLQFDIEEDSVSQQFCPGLSLSTFVKNVNKSNFLAFAHTFFSSSNV